MALQIASLKDASGLFVAHPDESESVVSPLIASEVYRMGNSGAAVFNSDGSDKALIHEVHFNGKASAAGLVYLETLVGGDHVLAWFPSPGGVFSKRFRRPLLFDSGWKLDCFVSAGSINATIVYERVVV